MRASAALGLGALLTLALAIVPGPSAETVAASTVGTREVRHFETADVDISRPGGLAYASSARAFYVVPAAHDPGGRTSIGVFDFLGDPGRPSPIELPVAGLEVAFDARGSRLVFLDDRANTLTTVGVGDSGLPIATTTRSRLLQLAPLEAAGIAIDPASGTLFVLDRLSRRIAAVAEAAWAGSSSSGRGGVAWIDLAGLPGGDLRDLAFDASRGRFLLLDGSAPAVHELAGDGRLVRSAHLGTIRDPRALVVAPSGDLTDHPTATSLYVADAGSPGMPQSARVVELEAAEAGPSTTAATAASTTSSSSLVNTIETWRWSPASPDPSGLAYDSTANRLLVVDGEVDEMSIYAGANYYEATLAGSLVRTTNTVNFSREPVGLAFDPAGRAFVSDDDQRRVFQVTLGNGRLDQTDPVTSFSTSSFGSGDPEGTAYDRVGDRLFIADGINHEIYEVSAVDGLFGNGNDQVRHFDTRVLGVVDPEAVEFDATKGTLYTMGADGAKIVEVTTSGTLVSEIDTSYLPLDRPAGLAYAPRSIDPAQRSFYIADRKVDNNTDSRENDGVIYEIAPGSSGGGSTPAPGDVRVAAGSDDAEESASGSVNLTSSDLELVTDSSVQTVGLRFPGLAVPRGAIITNANIQFSADESRSEATALTFRAQAADNAPTFTTATFGVSARPRTAASVAWSPTAWAAGEAGANQRTPDLKTLVQEVVSRPGWASGNAIAFIVTGSGRRTAVAYNGNATRAPLLHVEFSTAGVNQPPSVSAGPDQTITLPASATLDGTVLDDGQPNPTPTTSWSKVSGPGTVTFADPGAVDTTASFSAAGTYVLRLTADDGALTTSDDVTIVVNPASSTSGAVDVRVATGSDDAEEAASGSVKLTSPDLDLVTDDTQQTIGIRFAGVALPAGATIMNAYIQFTADETQSGATPLTLTAQAADNAPTFSTATSNISTRPRTAASVAWSPAPWAAGEAGANQRTPDLKTLVQAVVGRPGWASGNAIAFVVTGSGLRTAIAYNGSATRAPLLHVEYE